MMAFSAVAEGKKMNENKRDAKKGKVSQKKKRERDRNGVCKEKTT